MLVTVTIFQQNESHLMKELDQHINMIMSAVRGQHEALKQKLQNNFIEIKKPVTDELRRCNSLKTSMRELMKKVSEIKRTTDTGLRIAVSSFWIPVNGNFDKQ